MGRHRCNGETVTWPFSRDSCRPRSGHWCAPLAASGMQGAQDEQLIRGACPPQGMCRTEGCIAMFSMSCATSQHKPATGAPMAPSCTWPVQSVAGRGWHPATKSAHTYLSYRHMCPLTPARLTTYNVAFTAAQRLIYLPLYDSFGRMASRALLGLHPNVVHITDLRGST